MDVRDQIKRRLSISDVAALYVDLKPAGKNLKALCPFHTEKTPSFFVMPEKDQFTCYGCNKFGDIFTMVEEMENVSFPEAMNFLIEKFNIPVEKTGRRQHISTDDYAKINDITVKYFRDNLYDTPEGKNAMAYLRKRGIGEDTVKQFDLGYAENKWDGLYNHLRKQSCDIAKAVELGLLVQNPEKRSVYDRFRGRIMFPIFSESGKLLAFGGRTLFDDPGKYLNSPDTPIYKKSLHLYGFNIAKNAIREQKKAILVEGYFDMVSLYQNGVKNAVASLGTALTENQIYLLKRFSESIYIYYDSDKAGVTAAVRGIEKMFEQNINPRIVDTTGAGADDAKDPDDFIRQKGLKGFNQLLEDASDGFKFLLRNIARKYDLQIPERKSQAIGSMMTFLGKFSDPLVRDEYIRMAADFFNVDEKLLKFQNKSRSNVPEDTPVNGLTTTPAERIFLRSILEKPELIDSFALKRIFNDELLSVLSSRNIISLLLSRYNSKTKKIEDLGKIAQPLSRPEQAELRDIFEVARRGGSDAETLGQNVESSVHKFADMLNSQRFRQLDRKLKIAEKESNTDEIL
ncbi:MAG: DNA primase, partial [bacterium]|nr:DNA primase [bacterium]